MNILIENPIIEKISAWKKLISCKNSFVRRNHITIEITNPLIINEGKKKDNILIIPNIFIVFITTTNFTKFIRFTYSYECISNILRSIYRTITLIITVTTKFIKKLTGFENIFNTFSIIKIFSLEFKKLYTSFFILSSPFISFIYL